MIFNLTFLCHRFRLFLAVKIFSEALFNTLRRFDVEFSWKDCVTSIKHMMYANSLFCSPAHSYTSVMKKERQNEDKDKISLRQTFELTSDK